jgi:hypothetical protein
MPCGLAGSGGNAVPFKSGFDPVHAVALQVFPVDALYDFSLLRILKLLKIKRTSLEILFM